MTGISAAYDNKTVLENINLTVFERDFLGVIGPNGGGKTTLIKVMLGLLNPTAGKVTFYQEGKTGISEACGLYQLHSFFQIHHSPGY